MVNTANHALKNGYTIELDCDVSEKTFSSKHGMAIIPNDETKLFEGIKNSYARKDNNS